MKKGNILLLAAAGLLLSCGQYKEKKLFEQIKRYPTSELIAQYQQEYADGSYMGAVKNVYKPMADVLEGSNYKALLNLADTVSSDTVKRVALRRAEEEMVKAINETPSSSMCEVYLSHFPQGAHVAEISQKKEQLKQEEAVRKAQQEKSARIDRMLDQLQRNIRIANRKFWQGDMEWMNQDANNPYNTHMRVLNLRSQMTPAQLRRFEAIMNTAKIPWD